jgi:WD40 repeat protein
LKRFWFFILLLSLSACMFQPGILTPTTIFPTKSSTPTPVLIPTTTIQPSTIVFTQTAYPTVRSQATFAQPWPSFTPSPTIPAPTIPQISDITGPVEGPWLIYYIGDHIGSAETWAVSDMAGKYHYRIDLPAVPDGRWSVNIPSRGNFIAIHLLPYQITSDSLNYEVWIYSLKEGRLVRKIPQLSIEALQVVRSNPFLIPRNKMLAFQHPIVSAVQESPEWSPDGRYLAFSAASDGPDVNLYFYDAQADRIQQLTYQVHQARFRSWSPDGRYIIYNQELASDTYFEQGSWLLDLKDGQSRYLSKVRVTDRFQWISSESLLVSKIAHESPFLNLRKVDVVSGQEKMLFSKPFAEYAIEPIFGVVFIDKTSSAFWDWPDEEKGIYQLFEDGSEKKLASGDFMNLQWNAALGLFTVNDQKNLDAIAFDLYGVEKLHFPTGGIFEVSPDGKWIVAGGNLYHPDGILVTSIGSGEMLWTPDSSDLYRVTPEGDLYLHQSSASWKGELIDSQKVISPVKIIQPAP